MKFQAFSWYVDDTYTELENGKDQMRFTVHIYGKTQEGQSVALHVSDFRPSFCVKYDADCVVKAEARIRIYDDIVSAIREVCLSDSETVKSGYRYVHLDPNDLDTTGETEEKILWRKNAWGFNRNEEPFFQFTFKSLLAYNKVLQLFRALHDMKMHGKSKSHAEWTFFCESYQQVKTKKVDDMAPGDGGLPAQQNSKSKSDAVQEFLDKSAVEYGVPAIVLRFVWKLREKRIDLDMVKCTLFDVIDPILRFAHVRKLPTAGWIDVRKGGEADNCISTCDIELEARYDDLFPYETDMICKAIKEMAFDIESYSHDGSFPDPADSRNYVYQIGITIKQYGEREIHRLLLHFETPRHLRGTNSGECAPIEDIPTCLRSMRPVEDCENGECRYGHDMYDMRTEIRSYRTEAELLSGFSKLIVTEDPDLIYGYNSDVFDWKYLWTRADVVFKNFPEPLKTFRRMSRNKNHQCRIKEDAFKSAAFGDNVYNRVDIPGRLNIDLMVWVQRNMPSDRYPSVSLNTVANKEIGEEKRDVEAREIFQAFRSGDPKQLAVIGDYCCQDTMLVQKLVDKLDVVTQMFEMANITDTPPMYLLQKGQQIKCFSQISKEAAEQNFLVPVAKERDAEAGKFKGATVLNPKIGLYKSPVAVLDFASLYPSIQMAYNVCYTTIVLKDDLYNQIKQLAAQGKPLHIDGVDYELIEWEEEWIIYRPNDGPQQEFSSVEEASEVCKKKQLLANLADEFDPVWTTQKKAYSFAFAQHQPSIIPELQRKMKMFRKAVRGTMAGIEHSKDPDDQLRYRVLNGRQLAIKVTMNSLYGFTSAFKLHLRELAASVTAKGRQMIDQTQHFMDNEFNAIAKRRLWTAEDCDTFFMKDGKEIVGVREGNQLVFNNRAGQEVARLQIGASPDGWVRKFPSARLGQPWIDRDLGICVVAGDTDSVFCNFPNASLDETISLCHKASELLTDTVFNRRPIEMEYEKTYLPMVIQKKKNYVGVKFEMDSIRWKMDYKGIAVKRRDSCNFTKEVFWSVIYPSLGVEAVTTTNGKTKIQKAQFTIEEGPRKALDAMRVKLQKMVNGSVDHEDLYLFKSIKSEYKGPECANCSGAGKMKEDEKVHDEFAVWQICSDCSGRGKIINLPHVRLADRMKARDPGSAPVPGQRFPYIIIYDHTQETNINPEDPTYARRMGLSPDWMFYLNQQVRKPVTKFMTLVGQQEATNLVFAEIEKALYENRLRDRLKIADSAKMDFFKSTKKRAAASPAPLKVPSGMKKRPKKLSDESKSCQKITNFFN